MDKNNISNSINYFLKGKLNASKEVKLLNWIKSDEDNFNNFKQELKVQEVKLPHKLDFNTNQSWRTLERNLFGKSNQVRNLYIRIASVAAAFVVGIFITSLLYLNDNGFYQKQAELQTFTVPYGAKSNISLPDGSTVVLNSGSTLKFPSRFEGARCVELNGEAFFEVKKSKETFTVSTSLGAIEVKGTSFNIKAHKNEPMLTTLVTGSVKVHENANFSEALLKPGDHAIVSNNGDITIVQVDSELYTSWKDGRLLFRHEYLPSMIKRLERWYNISIELDNDSRLEKLWFTGTIEMESFSEVLDLLKKTSPVDYTYDHNNRTIKIFHTNKN